MAWNLSVDKATDSARRVIVNCIGVHSATPAGNPPVTVDTSGNTTKVVDLEDVNASGLYLKAIRGAATPYAEGRGNLRLMTESGTTVFVITPQMKWVDLDCCSWDTGDENLHLVWYSAGQSSNIDADYSLSLEFTKKA